MVVVAAIPRESENRAAAVTPGFFVDIGKLKRRSLRKPLISPSAIT
jgi:hypothetical protein